MNKISNGGSPLEKNIMTISMIVILGLIFCSCYRKKNADFSGEWMLSELYNLEGFMALDQDNYKVTGGYVYYSAFNKLAGATIEGNVKGDTLYYVENMSTGDINEGIAIISKDGNSFQMYSKLATGSSYGEMWKATKVKFDTLDANTRKKWWQAMEKFVNKTK